MYATDSVISFGQIVTIVIFLGVIASVAIIVVMLAKGKLPKFELMSSAAGSLTVLETRRIGRTGYVSLVRVDRSRFLIADNGQSIHIVPVSAAIPGETEAGK